MLIDIKKISIDNDHYNYEDGLIRMNRWYTLEVSQTRAIEWDSASETSMVNKTTIPTVECYRYS